ncbi:hypothetical protein PoB_004460500 [Plakobranchus ocellatus]|uniref:Uncharacterized protein n=1 Tax=Plakobranchus ocellatus TaxID=259542 RepID=A0AAV4BBV6_9GAST|nr:hypothetical protein PoB_004460500 [Plakobranchus ocellatus]
MQNSYLLFMHPEQEHINKSCFLPAIFYSLDVVEPPTATSRGLILLSSLLLLLSSAASTTNMCSFRRCDFKSSGAAQESRSITLRTAHPPFSPVLATA